MPQPNKIPKAFAASGDRNIIPESTGTLGLASWNEGFPAITSVPFSEGGIAPKRADFNGIFNALSLATLWQQQGGFYAYDNATDYEVVNVVKYNNDLYKCLTANGPSSSIKAPTNTTFWSKVMTAADTAAAYLPLTTIQTGTWTPTLLGNSTPGELVVTTANGNYVKIGQLVFVDCQLVVRAKPSYEDYPTGLVLVGGLPYNAISAADNFVCNGVGGIDDCCRSLIIAYIQSGNRMIIGKLTNNQRQNAIFSSSVTTGSNIQLSTADNTTLRISGSYRA